ncbi:hypothetical protein [Shewanella maritima]|uniref:hypothetical protein n=1 Tax=Shewanella maritima TaxID=2520507 RepID=UPI003735F35D
MSNFSDFFTQINQDSDLLESYKANPREVMEQHGLSEEQIQAVLSGDLEKIKAFDGSDMKSFMIIHHP